MTWEVLVSITSNEPDVRTNVEKAGDRLLSVYQFADGKIFFSTHTTLADDSHKYIYNEVPIEDSLQGRWTYIYYAYSRKEAKTFNYLRTFDGKSYENSLPTLHRLPKYIGIYKGKDGIHTPFNGKLAYCIFMVGAGAYRDANFD